MECLWEDNGIAVADLDVERPVPVDLTNPNPDNAVVVPVALDELPLNV